jgi:hypothetical protein
MKSFQLLLLLTLTIFSNLLGQSKIKSSTVDKTETQTNKLIGTWKLIEFADLDSTTLKWTYPYGENPKRIPQRTFLDFMQLPYDILN